MIFDGLGEGKKMTIEEAKAVNSSKLLVIWRPEEQLPEDQQYALVYEVN